jgi:hypothetical protein
MKSQARLVALLIGALSYLIIS